MNPLCTGLIFRECAWQRWPLCSGLLLYLSNYPSTPHHLNSSAGLNIDEPMCRPCHHSQPTPCHPNWFNCAAFTHHANAFGCCVGSRLQSPAHFRIRGVQCRAGCGACARGCGHRFALGDGDVSRFVEAANVWLHMILTHVCGQMLPATHRIRVPSPSGYCRPFCWTALETSPRPIRLNYAPLSCRLPLGSRMHSLLLHQRALPPLFAFLRNL